MTKQFEVGKSYATRSSVDYDSWFRVTVIGRTGKTVHLRRDGYSEDRTCHIRVNDDVETIKPWGSYSMCPVIWATDEGKGESA
jgi:hypothetical protein